MREILKASAVLLGMAACHPAVSGTPAPAERPPQVTVRQLLTTQALAGHTVEVTGRCLDADARVIATGTRPRTGRDWQLEDGGVAIWVSGPRPDECGADGTTVITGFVAMDSLPHLSRPRVVRHYLVLR